MGDFNCTREEPPYAVMMNSSAIQLNDPAPQPAPGTFCGFEVNSIECRPIDYIFYSTHWSAKKYEVAADHEGKYYPSDHLPVLAELTSR